jgi:hypothetical protein
MNEQTFSNEEELRKINNAVDRAERLRRKMEEALEPDEVWNEAQGREQQSNKYVPPFMQQDNKTAQRPMETGHSLDGLYEMEIDAQADGVEA